MTAFTALCWKMYCTYYRRIKTFVTLMLFCAVVSLLIVFQILTNSKTMKVVLTIPKPITISEVKLRYTTVQIMYTPVNKETDSIMKKFQDNNLKPKVILKSVKGADNETSMESTLRKIFSTSNSLSIGFGIIFNKVTSTSLIYTIRCTNKLEWKTDEWFTEETIPYKAGYNYVTSGFLLIQALVNIGYLSQLGIDESTSPWSMQEFPFPEISLSEGLQRKKLTFIIGVILSLLPVYLIMINYVTTENSNGEKELMVLHGIKPIYIYIYWIAFFFILLLCCIIIITVLFTTSHIFDTPLLKHTNTFVFTFFLIVYSIAMMFLVLAICSAINTTIFAQLILLLITMFTLTIITQWRPATASGTGFFINLIPIGAFYQGLSLIVEAEVSGTGISSRDIYNFNWDQHYGPYPFLILLMILSIVLYVFIYFYLEAVIPNRFGVAKPWNFIFKRFMKKDENKETHNEDKRKKSIIENVKLSPGIQVKNLYKAYGSFNAINNITMDIYKNQITVLLGHDASGKTTFFLVLSGVHSPTSGQVIYNSNDIFQNLTLYRKSLGFCTQENLIMCDLSVKEQIMFFGKINDLSHVSLMDSTDNLMSKLSLTNHANMLPYKLTRGLRRKLCLANTLVSDPSILLLDDPTAGLDPESRRNIWDVLLGLKENKIIIISTHFTDEADVLGDRIAVLAQGELKCYGSMAFLRKHYGSGHKIVVSYQKENTKGIIKAAEGYSYARTSDHSHLKKITIEIPMDSTSQMSAVLYQIENLISNTSKISVYSSSVEELLLKVLEKERIITGFDEKEIKTLHSLKGKNKGSSRFIHQFIVLLYKRFICLKQANFSLILMLIIFPIISTILLYEVYKKLFTLYTPPLNLDLAQYGKTNVLIEGNQDNIDAKTFEKVISKYYGKAIFEKNITRVLLQMVRNQSDELKHSYIIAADFKKTPMILYSSFAYHSLPIAINVIYNYFLEKNKPGATIQTVNHPYEFDDQSCEEDLMKNTLAIPLLWTMFAVFLMVCLGILVIFPMKENTIGFKTLQKTTGLSPLLYWAANLLFDTVIVCLVLSLIFFVTVIIDKLGIFWNLELIGAFMLVLFLFSIVIILISYLSSFFLTDSDVAMTRISIGLISLALLYALLVYIFSSYTYILEMCLLKLSPLSAVLSANMIIFPNAIIRRRCEGCMTDERKNKCLNAQQPFMKNSEFNKYQQALLDCMLFLILLLLLLEYNIVQEIINHVLVLIYKYIFKDKEEEEPDNDVVAERHLVETQLTDLCTTTKRKQAESTAARGTSVRISRLSEIQTKTEPKKESVYEEHAHKEIVIYVDGLGKKYSRTSVAVHDVTFVNEGGECFGLLGTKGAGKTTTFKMLTGAIVPTKGNAVIASRKIHSLNSCSSSFIKNIGYCPQNHCLMYSMTARQLLYMFALLRCIKIKNVNTLVDWWIKNLDLHLCDKPCGTYSKGDKRKLSTGLALIGEPKVILLDEPTSGVDLFTKRKLWQIFHLIKQTKQAMIITSHSMKDCEMVCTKLTVLVKGRMKCIGDVHYLKQKFAVGYTIMLKIDVEASEANINNIKKAVFSTFGAKCELKEENKGSIFFYVREANFAWSKEFSKMETLKSSIKGIEEYSINATAIEQFLSSNN